MTSLRCLLGLHSYPRQSGKVIDVVTFTLLVRCRRCKKPFDFATGREATDEDLMFLLLDEEAREG